jgi:hypothetical protein
VGDETLTVPRDSGVLVGPDRLRQVSNDAEVLWLILGAPEEVEFPPGAKPKPDLSLIYLVDPKRLPKEMAAGIVPTPSVVAPASCPRQVLQVFLSADFDDCFSNFR